MATDNQDPFPNLKDHPFVHLSDSTYGLTPTKIVKGKTFMWHSVCSAHQFHNPKCETCGVGSWGEIIQVIQRG